MDVKAMYVASPRTFIMYVASPRTFILVVQYKHDECPGGSNIHGLYIHSFLSANDVEGCMDWLVGEVVFLLQLSLQVPLVVHNVSVRLNQSRLGAEIYHMYSSCPDNACIWTHYLFCVRKPLVSPSCMLNICCTQYCSLYFQIHWLSLVALVLVCCFYKVKANKTNN